MVNCTALRVARAKMNITQTELAKRVGITQTHYNRIEHGKRDGSVKTLQAICRELGISVNELLD